MYQSRLLPGRLMEEEFVCRKFRRVLPDRGNKGRGLLQFWAEQGGMRTIDISDVVRIW